MPNITGEAYVRLLSNGSNIIDDKSGAFLYDFKTGVIWGGVIDFSLGNDSIKTDTFKFNAANSNAFYKSINTVQPDSLRISAIVRT